MHMANSYAEYIRPGYPKYLFLKALPIDNKVLAVIRFFVPKMILRMFFYVIETKGFA